jgi:hypothetical protein
MHDESTAQDAPALTAESTTRPQIGQAWQGGLYAGLCRGADGAPDYHLVLSEATPGQRMPWSSAMAWAAQLQHNGLADWSLPNRRESALLFSSLKHEIGDDWHWTGEEYSGSYAWSQGFDDGGQNNDHKGYEGRCRAVRRIPA